jgi:hypothetical protein
MLSGSSGTEAKRQQADSRRRARDSFTQGVDREAWDTQQGLNQSKSRKWPETEVVSPAGFEPAFSALPNQTL